MRISDWSSDVCSSDLQAGNGDVVTAEGAIDVGVDGNAHVELRLRSGSASVKARDTKDKQSESMPPTINRTVLYAGGDVATRVVTAATAEMRNWASGWGEKGEIATGAQNGGDMRFDQRHTENRKVRGKGSDKVQNRGYVQT